MAKLADQFSFRITERVRRFYEQKARKEKRKLSDVLRAALEDQAAILTAYQAKQGKPRSIKETIFD